MHLMKEVKYMEENKDIIVELKCLEDKYYLEFNLSSVKIINLYDENMEQLNELFTQIMNDLIQSNLKFELVISPEAKQGSNQLACEVSETYIKELNIEIDELIQSDNLKEIRKHKVEL